MNTIEIHHNRARGRFEVTQESQTAYLEYRRQVGQIILAHTQVPKELEGRGLGGALAKAGLEHARAEGLKVVPECEFVQAYLKRHPEYEDLLVSEGE